MASLRLALFAATCALLLAASASPPLPPVGGVVQRDVGDEMGWTTVPSAANGTEETLTQWAERQRFHVDDVLDFKSWNGTVLLLAPAAAAMRFVGGGDSTWFALDRPGTFYFVSGVPGRCEAGQRMAVRVVGAQAPPSVVFKLTPSAWLWVAAVGVFLFLLMGIFVFCVNEQAKVMATAFLGALGAR